MPGEKRKVEWIKAKIEKLFLPPSGAAFKLPWWLVFNSPVSAAEAVTFSPAALITSSRVCFLGMPGNSGAAPGAEMKKLLCTCLFVLCNSRAFHTSASFGAATARIKGHAFFTRPLLLPASTLFHRRAPSFFIFFILHGVLLRRATALARNGTTSIFFPRLGLVLRSLRI